jgi:hypothetical protein
MRTLPMLTPLRVAIAYDRCAGAIWEGDAGTVRAGVAWFEAWWTDDAPPEPRLWPHAISLEAGTGTAIRWYAEGDLILGYVPRRTQGCYRIPASAVLPRLVGRSAREHLSPQLGLSDRSLG